MEKTHYLVYQIKKEGININTDVFLAADFQADIFSPWPVIEVFFIFNNNLFISAPAP